MKKTKIKVIAGVAVAAVAAVSLAGCGKSKPEVHPDESKRSAVHTENQLFVNEYKMDVTLNADDKKIDIISTANLENNTETTLEEIYFLNPSAQVYAKQENTGKNWEISDIVAGDDSTKLDFTVDAEKPWLIKVNLGDKKLAPKDKLDVTMTVKEDVPFGGSRFGYYNLGDYSQFVLTSCFPQVAEYRAGEWIINDPVWTEENFKDNTYSEFTDYHVKVHAPEGYMAAASGVELYDEDGTINIEAVDVQNFALVLSDGFRSAFYANDDMTVNFYFMVDAKSYKEAKDVYELVMPVTIDWLVDKISKYAWNQYDVVPIYDDSGCNTYTGLMTYGGKDIHDGLDGAKIDDYRVSMVPIFKDGILNQWFEEMVNSNKATDGWLTRGFLTWFDDFIAISATNDKPSRHINEILDEARKEHPEEMKMMLNDTFKDDETAYIVQCYRGAEFLEALYNELGTNDFVAVLNEYMKEYLLKDVDSKAFTEVLLKHDNGKIQPLIDQYFNK